MVTVPDIEKPKRQLIFGWKGIQAYFGGEIPLNTLKRWAREGGMPVCRDGDSPHGRIYADVDELIDWEIERKRVLTKGNS